MRFISSLLAFVALSKVSAINQTRKYVQEKFIDIETQAKSNNAVVFGQDDCKVCQEAFALLKEKSVKSTYINMDDEMGAHFKDLVAEWTNKKDAPYVFVAHEFIGGESELETLIGQNKNLRNYIKKKLNPTDDTSE